LWSYQAFEKVSVSASASAFDAKCINMHQPLQHERSMKNMEENEKYIHQVRLHPRRLRKLGPAKQREANPALTENRAGAASDGALDFQISCYKISAYSC
jgi:hypothetical protein